MNCRLIGELYFQRRVSVSDRRFGTRDTVSQVMRAPDVYLSTDPFISRRSREMNPATDDAPQYDQWVAMWDESSESCRECVQAMPPDEQREIQDTSGQLVVAQPNIPLPTHRPQTGSIAVSPTVQRLLANRWAVCGLLLCCGPLGLPLLWLSPRFSTVTKCVATILLMSVTVLLPIAIYWWCCEVLLRPLVDAFGPRG